MPEAPGSDDTAKIAALESRLSTAAAAAPSGTIAVALSGGLDSRFLCHMLSRAGIPLRALHVNGPHVPSHEHTFAVGWAASRGIPLSVVSVDPLGKPELRNNPRERCYLCKTAVFTELRTAADGAPLMDGTNVSDLFEHRPGMKALAELAVISPLAETGFSKNDIQRIASATGIENPNQAAQPCLLTRFGYGAILSAVVLEAVDAGENAIRAVLEKNGEGGTAFRLRYETLSSPALHIALKTISREIVPALQEALAASGFGGIPIREMPHLSGYFDRQPVG